MQLVNFKGIKTDTPDKMTGPEYFRRLENFNQDSITGFNQIQMPEVINTIGGKGYGFIQFKFLDDDNVLQDDVLSIFDGTLYKNSLSGHQAVISGLKEDDYMFQIFNDELYMAAEGQNVKVYNGINNSVRDMGSPEAIIHTVGGVLTGQYSYTMTYVKGGIERVIDSFSNTLNVTSAQIRLDLPIGYAGVTDRKLYRTSAGGSAYLLLATIADNTTLTFLDNIPDSSLTTPLPTFNVLAQPKAKFITTAFGKLVLSGDPNFPTQLFVGEAGLEVIDTTIFVDISNLGNDNTPIRGLQNGYDKVYVWSEIQQYAADASGTLVSVRQLQSNVGILSGYSAIRLPKDKGIEAGVIFYASDGTFRIAVGNFSRELQNSLDNISADNYAQNIINELKSDGFLRAKGVYFEYKFHLTFPEQKKVITYDIRTNSFHNVVNVNASAWALIDGALYAQTADGNIEKWYQQQLYRGKYLGGVAESPAISVNSEIKKINKITFWLSEEKRVRAKVTIIIEDDVLNAIVGNIEINGGDYAKSDFEMNDFNTNVRDDDYRVVHLDRYGRWLKYIIEPEEGRVLVRAIDISTDDTDDEEEG